MNKFNKIINYNWKNFKFKFKIIPKYSLNNKQI